MRLSRLLCQLFTICLAGAMFSPTAVSAATMKPAVQPGSAPANCQPCLFYAGDTDVNAPNWNALFNSQTFVDFGGVYVPFTVPEGQQWNVTGLLVNLITIADQVPRNSYWGLRSGVTSGDGGTLVSSGEAGSVFGGYVNCGGIAVNCFTVEVKGLNVSLVPGEYWLEVLPECATAFNECANNKYYLLTVDDNPPRNQYGPPEPKDQSYFTDTYSHYNFFPTWGPSGVCTVGCDRFSTGVMGTATPLE